MPGGSSKATTRGAPKSNSDTADDTTPATLQSVDDKLNTIMQILNINTDDIKEIKKEQKELGLSIELCHTNIDDLKILIKAQDNKINECNDAVHRTGKGNNAEPRPIIIKFISRLDRDEILRCRKVRRHLKATDLGYSSENSIYINESLTSSTRELLKLTKARAKERNYSQVWTSIVPTSFERTRETQHL
ncbi:hypothetical protein J6590_004717 [Homalodisca vitripennis]|nr:hypothetical protein J6590_004717 [Homalodisca vitripennis]